MSDMMIAIPSRGRWVTANGRRHTLRCLHESLIPHVVMFNHVEDGDKYRTEEYQKLTSDIVTLGYWSIGEKRRQMAVEAKKRGYKKIFFIDDDVNILQRRAEDNWQLRYAEDDETVLMYQKISQFLDDGYGQISLGAREGNNQLGLGGPDNLIDCRRAMRANAFFVDEFLALEHDRVRTMEDFDIQMQLLRSGRPTAVTVFWATGQSATNTSGGCALWRTHKIHEESVRTLAELFPGLVHPRMKENKTGGGFGTRLEATFMWKRAYELGVAEKAKQ